MCAENVHKPRSQLVVAEAAIRSKEATICQGRYRSVQIASAQSKSRQTEKGGQIRQCCSSGFCHGNIARCRECRYRGPRVGTANGDGTPHERNHEQRQVCSCAQKGQASRVYRPDEETWQRAQQVPRTSTVRATVGGRSSWMVAQKAAKRHYKMVTEPGVPAVPIVTTCIFQNSFSL